MPGTTKAYDRAQDRAGELRRGLHRHFTRDGELDAQEASLLIQADELCVENNIVATRIRFAVRGLGGGRIHRSLRCEARALVRLADALEELGQNENGSASSSHEAA